MLFGAATTHTAKAGTSIIGTVLHPIFVLVGYVLAFFYGLIPNYAVAIALLTVAVMIVVFPLTRASARSMMRMQLLAPEMKKIQARYKPKPGMPALERQELRQKMNEEVMALYRENGVNPTGGCLPMFLQFPILIVLYDVVRGLAKTADVLNAKGQKIYVHGKLLVKATPQNIPKTSRMYRDLVAANGQMHVLGINLADSVRTHQPHVVDVLPYALLVLIAVGLQYVSIWQVTNRNPAAAASNQQMQQMQKYMPLIFLVLYIALPAGVGVYFIVSSLFRVGQQEWMYKHDPTIVKAIQELTKRKHAEALNPSPDTADSKGATRDSTGGKGFLARMREASASPGSARPGAGPPQRSTGNGPKRSATNGSKAAASQNGSRNPTPAKRPSPQASRSAGSGGGSKSQPRSRDKRPRKGR
ncbi:MAG: membrane protein insertase YidC [Acidimicrobiales bacterium]|jgi:YidC/Oxa1 family membrane protein insertase